MHNPQVELRDLAAVRRGLGAGLCFNRQIGEHWETLGTMLH